MTAVAFAPGAPRASHLQHPTRREWLADAAVHVAGLAFGVCAAVVLARVALPSGNLRLVGALGLYTIGLLLMLSLSAAYNLAVDPALRRRLRPLDHAAIYIMIAGSYAPLALIALHGSGGLGLFTLTWTAALIGAAIKIVFPGRFERAALVAYLVLGWCVLPLLGPLVDAVPEPGLTLLGIGGVLYTVGVVFHLAERLPYNIAIWHAFVLAAAVCHFVAIWQYVAVPFSA